LRFFALRVTVEPKIPGAVIPRSVLMCIDFNIPRANKVIVEWDGCLVGFLLVDVKWQGIQFHRFSEFVQRAKINRLIVSIIGRALPHNDSAFTTFFFCVFIVPNF
jgi:hypothetical protein